MYAANALHTALYGVLNGALTGGAYDAVPGSAAYPYTVIGELTEVPDDSFSTEASEVTCTFHVWSAAGSGAEVDTIMAEIDGVLHREPPTVAGSHCWRAVREFSQVMRDQDPDTGDVLRHGVVRYRFGLEAL